MASIYVKPSAVAVLFPLAVLLLVAAQPISGQLTNLLNTSVTGRLCCSTTGNCLLFFTPPLRNVPVLLNCTATNGSIVTVGQTITNAFGNFNFGLTNLTNISALIPCRVVVSLPLSSAVCPLLSATTGVLQAPVVTVTNLLTGIIGGVLNVVLTGVTGIFQLVQGIF